MFGKQHNAETPHINAQSTSPEGNKRRTGPFAGSAEKPNVAAMGNGDSLSVDNPAADLGAQTASEEVFVSSWKRKPWVRALSCVMSVLLAVTMFNTTGVDPLFSDGSQAVAEEGDGESVRPEVEAKANLDGLQSGAIEGAYLEALMPSNLVSAADVLPQAEAGAGDVASHLDPSLVAYGAPLAQGSGFSVQGKRVNLMYELGNLSSLLAGGYLGGTQEGDNLILTLDVPYLYTADDGSAASTLSYEEWLMRHAMAAEAKTAGADATVESVTAAAAASVKTFPQPPFPVRSSTPTAFPRVGQLTRSTAPATPSCLQKIWPSVFPAALSCVTKACLQPKVSSPAPTAPATPCLSRP